MKFWVGVTDNAWFNYLAAGNFDEVNFWQPSATPPFKNAPQGMPFLFKLKRPYNHIAGGGFFVTYSTLPIALVWEVFGAKNGAGSIEELQAMLEPLSGNRQMTRDIGCTILADPFFLSPDQWIADPAGWSSNIVRGKSYETASSDGSAIWSALEKRFVANQGSSQNVESNTLITAVNEIKGGYGKSAEIKPRLGQSAFQVLVTEAYKRRCAITGEKTLVALEAAHIVPFSKDHSHSVQNGLLLRADFHRLFDVGLVSVTQDLKIQISPRIKENWFNGKAYYRLHNTPLAVLPDLPEQQPDPDRLGWHYKNFFQI